MRRSEAARYARWAAAVALLLAVVVTGVYVYRAWQRAQARKAAPPPVPTTVQQRSLEFSFSKEEQGRTLFRVRASRATEFKAGKKSLLEDVWITIYGREGRRFDNIHTRECDYLPDPRRVVCAGQVEIALESAEEARDRPGLRVIHISTANVSFDGDTGEARTDQAVAFRFPYGHGRGAGVTYSTRDAVVYVHHDVEMTLTSRARPAGVAPPAAEPITLTGSGMEYHRYARTLRLLPPVRVRQGARELLAGELALEFDTALRARRLVAGQQPRLRSAEPHGQAELEADQFVALFHPHGWTEHVLAEGNVSGSWKGSAHDNRLRAQKVDIEMEPERNQPRVLTASGDVSVESQPTVAGRESQQLETAAVRVFFAANAGAKGQRIERAETLAPAVLEWKTADEATCIRGERLVADFAEGNRLRALSARSGAEVERRFAGRTPQLAASDELVMQFGPGGGWTEAEQRGNVRFREGDRSAQAERAKLLHATNTMELTGSVVLADPLTRTTAQALWLDQRTGEIRAAGGIRTAYLAPERSGITNLAPVPALISADQLRANHATGQALYSGKARLWQGDAVIEADSIELLRAARRLDARGKVQALLPQGQEAGAGSKEPTLWRVRAATLSYWGSEGRVQFEQNVTAQSRLGQISARRMELFLAAPEGGPQQLTRAVATGGVVVRAALQGQGRRGTAERAEYVVAEGKFVLSGGNPTLYDAARGSSASGRQLTFFLADDRILVDSAEGSRTLTRHRVEK